VGFLQGLLGGLPKQRHARQMQSPDEGDPPEPQRRGQDRGTT
jgi:hypothetical protein